MIGDHTTIYAGAKIYYGCVIGSGCTIHAGTVIGADGFGFAPNGDNYNKVPQIGNVVIEDNVEIGAMLVLTGPLWGYPYKKRRKTG